eukprot:TRINITY_DN8348_c0_g1_i2.p2 TRINITY_DN8348_c0_g1~~TRINITY_DN8348_c0_g1_i2.p2  ORF type:complete len:376 (+),score=136.55 TRINITY_DN8348_c0_g1_i2:69-1130(+)
MQRPAAGRAARSAGGGRRPRPAPGRAQRRCKACFVPPRDVTLADYQVVDCRWEERLGGGYGAAEYAKGRIKGAVYCDAENWAAAPTERSGSHPLPAVSDFAAWLRRSGLRPDGKPVLLYDDLAGAAPAARVRWMLRALGWESVWLLEGGWQGWHADGRHDLVDTSPPSPPRPVQAGGKFIFHPKEAHSQGAVDWLRRNFSDIVQLNPGWRFKCREVLTNNPHVCLYYANGHSRSVALYNATEAEVEEAMSELVNYGQNHAPRCPSFTCLHEPTVVSHSINSGYGNWYRNDAVARQDIDGRLDHIQPTTYETFERPGQARPLRMDKLNRGRGDDIFHPAASNITNQVHPIPVRL